jgi:hypothetical protein
MEVRLLCLRIYVSIENFSFAKWILEMAPLRNRVLF